MTFTSFFHPRSVPFEFLHKKTIGRNGLLLELLRSLHLQGSGNSQPWLLRGLRGIGKTHFLALLAGEIQQQPEISSRYEIVWLPEIQVYEIFSVATLFFSIYKELLRIKPKHALLESVDIDEDTSLFRKKLVQSLASYAKKENKKILVFVENIEMILDEFPPKERKQEESAFRSVLQDVPEIRWICTSSHFKSETLADPDRPLFNLFYERILHPLNEKETWDLWVSLQTDPSEISAHGALSTPERVSRRDILFALTGGNPRSLSILAAMQEYTRRSPFKSHSFFSALLDGLFWLLDLQTAFFEEELQQVAPRERAILACLALAEEELTQDKIAKETGLPKQALRTQLYRLCEQGFLKKIDLQKATIYSLKNGLFRLWYRYRKDRNPQSVALRFLRFWLPFLPLQDQASLSSWFDSIFQRSPSQTRAEISRIFFRFVVRHLLPPLFESKEALLHEEINEFRSPLLQAWDLLKEDPLKSEILLLSPSIRLHCSNDPIYLLLLSSISFSKGQIEEMDRSLSKFQEVFLRSSSLPWFEDAKKVEEWLQFFSLLLRLRFREASLSLCLQRKEERPICSFYLSFFSTLTWLGERFADFLQGKEEANAESLFQKIDRAFERAFLIDNENEQKEIFNSLIFLFFSFLLLNRDLRVSLEPANLGLEEKNNFYAWLSLGRSLFRASSIEEKSSLFQPFERISLSLASDWKDEERAFFQFFLKILFSKKEDQKILPSFFSTFLAEMLASDRLPEGLKGFYLLLQSALFFDDNEEMSSLRRIRMGLFLCRYDFFALFFGLGFLRTLLPKLPNDLVLHELSLLADELHGNDALKGFIQFYLLALQAEKEAEHQNVREEEEYWLRWPFETRLPLRKFVSLLREERKAYLASKTS